MSSSLQLIRSEDLEGDGLWFADGQGCKWRSSTLLGGRWVSLQLFHPPGFYVEFVDFAGSDLPCDDRCLYVFSTASFVAQAVDVSPITSEVLRKPL